MAVGKLAYTSSIQTPPQSLETPGRDHLTPDTERSQEETTSKKPPEGRDMRRKKPRLHLVKKCAPAPAPHKWARTLDDVYPITKELLDTIWEAPDRHKTSIRRKHGSSDVYFGKLTGHTDSDYFHLHCPKCKERLRILDFDFRMLRPVEKNIGWKPKPKKEFSIIFKIFCPKCRFTDFFKLSNLN